MKIRSCFVSNSSSSSFVCDICGEEASGMDMCLSEAQMYECLNGHTICESHLNNIDANNEIVKEKALKEILENEPDFNERDEEDRDEYLQDYINDMMYDARGELPSEFCPCCRFNALSDSDGYGYLLRRCGLTVEALRKEIQDEFDSYIDFCRYIKGK